MTPAPPAAARLGRALLLAALFGGVALRFVGLGDRLVWHDEVFTRLFVAGQHAGAWFDDLYAGEVQPVGRVQALQSLDPARTLADTARGLARDEPQHPPLYYLLARLWVGALADGIGTLRLLTASLSLAGFPVLCWLARELDPERRIGASALALSACSPFFVLYAQEAREYALWGALVIAATAALLRALRRGGALAWSTYAALLAASFYTSFSTAAVLLAHGLFVAATVRRPRPALAFLAASAAALALFAPWLLALSVHWASFRASMAWSGTVVIPRGALLAELALNACRTLYDPAVLPLPAWAGAALLSAAFLALPWTAPRPAAVLVVALVGVPIALTLGPDLVLGGIRSLSGRYLLPAWLGLILALAFLARRAPWALALPLALGLASGALSARVPAPWTKGVSVNLPAVAAAINAEDAPLVLGNEERHNPGNLLALSLLLRPDARMQFLRYGMDPGLGSAERAVFLFSPTPPFREALEASTGGRGRLLVEDVHLALWRLER